MIGVADSCGLALADYPIYREQSMSKLRAMACVAMMTASTGLFSPAVAQDYPRPIEGLQQQGMQIVGPLPTVGGMKAYAGYLDRMPYAMYLTPDGKHVLVGSIFDAEGKNITEAALEKAVSTPMADALRGALESSHWVADGKADAPRVIYVFTDPNCPYCHQFWQLSRPWIQSGKVQLRHIVVGIIREDSPGKAAAILGDAFPAQALNKNEENYAKGGIAPLPSIPSALKLKLLANQALMGNLNVHATPAIFYPDKQGRYQLQQGLPRAETIETVLGSR